MRVGRVNGRAARLAVCVVALTAVCAGSGCGGSSAPIAVRVGGVSIDTATVSHWARAIGLDAGVADVVERPGATGRERALAFLISAQWLSGEAADTGLTVSDSAVQRGLQERIEGMPNGESELKKEISSLGRTIADVKLEIDAELAAQKLSEMVSKRVPRVTSPDAATYYEHHQVEFAVPELREADLIESNPTRADAIALAKRIGPGSHFASMALREQVGKQTPSEDRLRDNGPLVHTIFSARPGVIAGPVSFDKKWSLVVVRKVLPAQIKPLAAVEGEIAGHLMSQRQGLARESFIEAYRRKWVARTDCRPGFVVQKCSQYHGRLVSEPDPLSFRTY